MNAPLPFISQANLALAKSCLRQSLAAPGLRRTATPVVRGLREITVRAQVAVALQGSKGQGRGPVAVFLPAYGRHGAALLRIYNIAAALRGAGWRCVILPSALTLAQRRRLLRAVGPDVVVMQGARHPLNRPDLYADYPVVFDMDDADFHLPHLEAPVRRAMDHVAGVIAGSRYVADWCRARGAQADVVWTATPLSRRQAKPQARRPPVVAWAQTAPMTYTAEADWVLQVMQQLTQRCPEVRLHLYDRQGAGDPAFLARFETAGIRTKWLKKARYSDYLASFEDVALGLAPLCPQNPFSRGKSFGKVLAYLDRRVPVLASDACEHGAFFDAGSAVVSNDAEVWVNEAARLLQDPQARQQMADRAFDQFEKRLSIKQASRRVDRVLRRYLT